MFCKDCKFHSSGYMWNGCKLLDTECYREYSDKPCPFIDDDYQVKEDVPELGLEKGTSV